MAEPSTDTVVDAAPAAASTATASEPASDAAPPAAAAAPPPKTYSMDPVLYLYTSLTAGSSHIITATSRLETILKANKVPFRGIDIATDEKAKMLWGRRAGKDASGRARKLPGLVQMGMVLGDIVDIEEWNEYGELKQNVKIVPLDADGNPLPPKKKNPAGTAAKKAAAAAAAAAAASAAATASTADGKENIKPAVSPGGSLANSIADLPRVELLKEMCSPDTHTNTFGSFNLAMRNIGEEAAQKAKAINKKPKSNVSKTEVKTSTSPDRPADVNTTPTVSVSAPAISGPVEAPTVLQSPTSTSWKNEPQSLEASVNNMAPTLESSLLFTPQKEVTKQVLSTPFSVTSPPPTFGGPIEVRTLMQSPKTTAWSTETSHSDTTSLQVKNTSEPKLDLSSTTLESVDASQPVIMHRGSIVEAASKEEIKRVEECLKIDEVDEATEEAVED